jgi:hypothetical protein
VRSKPASFHSYNYVTAPVVLYSTPDSLKLSGFYKIDPAPETQKPNSCGAAGTLSEHSEPTRHMKKHSAIPGEFLNPFAKPA